MEFSLKHEPIPANAKKFAADIVESAAQISNVKLDYSVASLQKVDEIIEGFRQDGCTSDDVAATLFGFGCYVGEVFVRHAGGKWRLAEETAMADIAGFQLVIELSRNYLCNPIGKTFKRMDNGEEDNLPFFYRAFTKGRLTKRWWQFWK